MNRSLISPVERRVLTMLSPSAPPGRVSMSNVMFGCSSVNASVSPVVNRFVVSVSSTSSESVTSSPSPPPSVAGALPSAAAVVPVVPVASVDASSSSSPQADRTNARPPTSASAPLSFLFMLLSPIPRSPRSVKRFKS